MGKQQSRNTKAMKFPDRNAAEGKKGETRDVIAPQEAPEVAQGRRSRL